VPQYLYGIGERKTREGRVSCNNLYISVSNSGLLNIKRTLEKEVLGRSNRLPTFDSKVIS
jgi:hypothetical protein